MWTLLRLKVQAELAPMQTKGQEEFNQYAASLQKELAAKRDTMVQTTSTIYYC